jgi:hypothetical protein
MIVSLVKLDSHTYRFDSRHVISDLHDQQIDPILGRIQNRINIYTSDFD